MKDTELSKLNVFFRKNKLDIYLDTTLLGCHPESIVISIQQDEIVFLKLEFNYIINYHIPVTNLNKIKLKLSKRKEKIELIPNKIIEKFVYILCDENNIFFVKSYNLYILNSISNKSK